MTDPLPQHAILEAAWDVFARYGYRRTAMADIAEAAGMSRPALYLHFANKEDIFASLARKFFDSRTHAMAEALAAPHPTSEATLRAAFLAKDGKFIEAVLNTPHGRELLESGDKRVDQIAAEAEQVITALFADWIASRPLRPGAGSAADIASVMMTALSGLKSHATSMEDYRAGQDRIAILFGALIG